MMRKPPSASMQKTYDECYLVCSTAIYFEGQNNEAEALRAWRNALDQIYYHNAYKLPSNWTPRSETEKALHDSLRAMELQCKERVDLLEALRKSRAEAEGDAKVDGANAAANGQAHRAQIKVSTPSASPNTWLGQDTVPQTSYADIPKPASTPERRPAQPKRPSFMAKRSSDKDTPRTRSLATSRPPAPQLTPPTDAANATRGRTPSPEKKSGGMLRTLRGSQPKDRASAAKASAVSRSQPAAAKAASQVWGGQSRPSIQSNSSSSSLAISSAAAAGQATTSWDPYTRSLVERPHPGREQALQQQQADSRRTSGVSYVQPPSPSEYQAPPSLTPIDDYGRSRNQPLPYPDYPPTHTYGHQSYAQQYAEHRQEAYMPSRAMPPPPPPHRTQPAAVAAVDKPRPQPPALSQVEPSTISYMKEYPNHPPNAKLPPPNPTASATRAPEPEQSAQQSSPRPTQTRTPPVVPRKAIKQANKIAGILSATSQRQNLDNATHWQAPSTNGRLKSDSQSSGSNMRASTDSGVGVMRNNSKTAKSKIASKPIPARAMTPPTTDDSDHATPPQSEKDAWAERTQHLLANLPPGVDEAAAKQIFNEIVIQGDEVHWDDVAGLDIAKSALKETVVYPFLRPDLFMGLREPARGMLLFGPPGTGKTMLARAVATESRSVFFAISASSLTSKFLGESEKLVRALFALAKALAPSIIFVDEIDSLLGARGGGTEHETTRRIKTEFLIGWSDLQRAAAGRDDPTGGDASRVLVLAATNLPWAIDEAARRRFVRRQYIPLPEDPVREKQLRTLLSAQKHSLRDRDLKALVQLTDGYSGSDITALAKDAAMGPLRSLGERLLHMSPEDIRPIDMRDFEASLVNIRPSVSKQGLKEFEDWAREFGERGG